MMNDGSRRVRDESRCMHLLHEVMGAILALH